jgi:cytoskeletal protein CcmA (bactofilin family)
LFNKDALFGKKEPGAPGDTTTTRHVNVTPDLRGTPSRPQGAVQPDAALNRAFAEPAKVADAQPSKTAAHVDDPVGSKLIVGPDIKLKGVEITDCDTLVVEGRVEASMDSRVVQIAEHGVFTGTATMDVAEIWGSFEGTLTVRKQLVIYATGRVSGQIRYGTIRIEEGGELSGDVSTLASGHNENSRGQSGSGAGEGKGNAYETLRAAKQPAKAGTSV